MTSYKLDQPWIEKYRPKLLDDIVGNEEAIARLKIIAEEGNMPNLILAGPPGTGKTSSVLCLARQLLGKNYKEAVLELNASDDRTLDVVRNKIKLFSQKKVSLPPGKHKIIILDEADSISKAAQQALRRIIEIYSSTTRFALACNTSSQIIEPLQSRCAMVRYRRLSSEEMLTRLKFVIDSEKIIQGDDESGLEALLFTAEGDMRNALNNLQSVNAGFGILTAENVFKICDQPHPMLVNDILESCMKNNFTEAQKRMDGLLNKGYSTIDVILTLGKVARSFEFGNEFLQLEFIKEIGKIHLRISDGVDSSLQLSSLMATLSQLNKPSK